MVRTLLYKRFHGLSELSFVLSESATRRWANCFAAPGTALGPLLLLLCKPSHALSRAGRTMAPGCSQFCRHAPCSRRTGPGYEQTSASSSLNRHVLLTWSWFISDPRQAGKTHVHTNMSAVRMGLSCGHHIVVLFHTGAASLPSWQDKQSCAGDCDVPRHGTINPPICLTALIRLQAQTLCHMRAVKNDLSQDQTEAA